MSLRKTRHSQVLPKGSASTDAIPPRRTTGASAAQFFLSAILLSIACSPRFRVAGLEGKAVDLRLQDFLLIPASLLAMFGSLGPSRKMLPVWGNWVLAFSVGSLVVVTYHLLIGENPAGRTIAYVGRTYESFILATVVATLVVMVGSGFQRRLLQVLHFVVLANTVWVVFQTASGQSITLLGGVLDSSVYGPRLIGEPSAFGAGAFFAFAGALGAAELRTRVRPAWWCCALLACGVSGAVLVQSRASVAAIFVMIAWLSAGAARGRGVDVVRSAYVMVTGVALLVATRADVLTRFSLLDIEASGEFRGTQIWAPLWRLWLSSPLVGVGPGMLGTPQVPISEAHNLFLRALVEYGTPVALIYVAAGAAVWRSSRRVAASDPDLTSRFFADLCFFYLLGVVVMGVAQDSLTAVMSTHLLMFAIGLFGGALVVSKSGIDRDQAASGGSARPSGVSRI
jgi:O-antigen ligase/polysaccharide polymerase Wzy-like membrane protein